MKKKAVALRIGPFDWFALFAAPLADGRARSRLVRGSARPRGLGVGILGRGPGAEPIARYVLFARGLPKGGVTHKIVAHGSAPGALVAEKLRAGGPAKMFYRLTQAP